MSKISDKLQQHLRTTRTEDTIHVVIALQPVSLPYESRSLARREQIASLQQAFNQELAPVAAAINSYGGNINESAWINQTVNATISTKNIEALAQLKEVCEIDLPARISRER